MFLPILPCLLDKGPVLDTLKKKFVDDLMLLETLYQQSILQHQLDDLLESTEQNKIKINFKKTKIMHFNISTKFDFLPQFSVLNCEPLEVIYQTRLLGVILTSDLSWTAHVADIARRATGKLWVVIRFKDLVGSCDQLLKVYQTHVRSTL